MTWLIIYINVKTPLRNLLINLITLLKIHEAK